MEEELFLGLRKNSGVSLSAFREKYNQEIEKLFANELKELLDRGLISMDNGYLKLTYNGRFLGNEVFQSFIGIL
jgi:coproporphyrinogen III oxidase-like Fe-S oxidoreductase